MPVLSVEANRIITDLRLKIRATTEEVDRLRAIIAEQKLIIESLQRGQPGAQNHQT